MNQYKPCVFTLLFVITCIILSCLYLVLDAQLNSKAGNVIMCALSEEVYTKVHSFKSTKDMWDIVALTYKGSTEVKRNKLSLLTCKYEISTMDENENIQSMFRQFQTILNELRGLGKSCDNYDYVDKIK